LRARVAYNKAGQALKALVSVNSQRPGGTAWHRPRPSGALTRSHFCGTLRAKAPAQNLGAGGLWGVCAEPSLFRQLRGARNVPTHVVFLP
jgi:hypothetical protein